METILTTNGYETDIGGNVFEWHTTAWEESELPALDIRDIGETVEVRGGNHSYTLTIEIEAKVSGTTSGTIMRDIVGDILKAVGTDTKFSGLIQNTRPLQIESFGFSQQDKRIASILITFELSYVTKAFSPFVLA